MKDQDYKTIRELHPCLAKRPGLTGRIHLPVSPSCNLMCRYCRRELTASKDRPGTSSCILPVEKVPGIVKRALELCPSITTVGIAGPGEALATGHAIEAFAMVDEMYPDLIKCMSTNGLMLFEKAEELHKVNVNTITVTVNAVDPHIQSKINEGIIYKGSVYRGVEAAEILIENQIRGIRKASGLGMIIKTNIVLIPGINDAHIEETAKRTSEAGARICNIIPLIPQAGMADIPAPDCTAIEAAREAAGKYTDVFRHCRHCRADAAGRLGKEDIGAELYGTNKYAEQTFSHG